MATEKRNRGIILNIVFIAVLALYPLRNIWLGVEVTDGGYSAGNYRFLENINPMWRFATYLANVTGHFLTELPGGRTMMGLRFYAALFISMLAVAMYLFFTKVVKISGFLAFFGELLAISLCWAPITILYHYMTYVFFDLGVVILYTGLVKEKRVLLFLAGIVLGMNVLVRFPNLTEAALIIAVWYYGVLQRKRIKDVVQETGICLAGFLAGAGGVLVSISAKYGLQEYIAGITKLMQMPSDASDYGLVEMVRNIILAYKSSAKWPFHLFLLTAAGCLISAAVYGILKNNAGKMTGLFGKGLFTCGILVLFRRWHAIGVFNIKYYTFECMFQWVAAFLILTVIAGIYMLFSKKSTRNEKLLSSMVLILIAVTPLGGNNHLYTNMNNMFLVFPFGLWLFWRLWRNLWEYGELVFGEKARRVSLFPVRMMLTAFLAAMSLQSLLFGAVFTFRDGVGGEKRDTRIEKNAVLSGMVTNAPLAEALEGLTEYVEREGLSDRSLILYGQIPALSFILDMQPAISTSWPDLASYNYEVMAEDMDRLRNNDSSDGKPLIILGEGPERWLRGEELTEEEYGRYMLNEKWDMLYEYMAEQGYEKTYENEMFFVYQ